MLLIPYNTHRFGKHSSNLKDQAISSQNLNNNSEAFVLINFCMFKHKEITSDVDCFLI